LDQGLIDWLHEDAHKDGVTRRIAADGGRLFCEGLSELK